MNIWPINVSAPAVPEPTANGFRNYFGQGNRLSPAEMLVERANLLDMATKWQKSSQTEGVHEGLDRATGKLKWTATPVDLVFGSNSELRAVAEAYAANDAREKFVKDFVAAWSKVMDLGRF